MALVVQKYGGTSVGTVERVKAVAQRVAKTKAEGNDLVVVVSAMGDTTDKLLELAYQTARRPSLRELDQLLATGEEQAVALVAMALEDLGLPALSLSGAQAGIRTIGRYGKARISQIRTERVRRALSAGQVVIIAGFQGVNRLSDVTTLGRGGSDTTAVAMAAALRADRCEIYTDVDGVYTADPRLVPEAAKLERISYEEMTELAWRGTKVLHPRAVELGKLYNMEIIVRSSFNDNPGTIITKVDSMEKINTISGIAYDLDVARITIAGVRMQPDSLHQIFGPLAVAEVSVDVIVESRGENLRSDVSFTISEKELPHVLPIVEKAAATIGAGGISSQGNLAKVSIIGTGMQNRPGYAAKMFKSLAMAGISIEMVTTSEIQVTCVIAKDRVQEAVRRLHKDFGLEKGR
ncbi:MAG: aspartate kinase [Chloroflexi bacterium]|nr:aspartate kinase [Chloroflexota bacterium]MCL5074927.1 aspartate kinase [Chloroflexota bacterium]